MGTTTATMIASTAAPAAQERASRLLMECFSRLSGLHATVLRGVILPADGLGTCR